ncbi:beta strand repeat-containing protein [Microvirga calopogonii]|uniref:beta strand repeat-containing protein n=1 Tax=Microvirga calopogonii TaxID=2078013 RepID=UPI0013B3821A|nr:calcium-binding protein [Microvirga calopogonii]
MATYDPATKTYTLETETDYVLAVSDGNANVVGNDQNNTITGNTGNNILDGGQGADTLRGGMGDDTYILSAGNDVIEEETADSGTDTIESQSSVDLTLTGQSALAFIENVVLTGTIDIDAIGNDLDNYLLGNDGVNSLSGGRGDDVLDGGLGEDTLVGGLGNDTYYVDSNQELLIEVSGEDSGHDIVYASVSFDFNATGRANIEDLILTGTANLTGSGNALDNRIVGNAGKNWLWGLDGDDSLEGGDGADTLDGGNNDDTLDGGAGNDVLAGGAGNDTYYVDSAGDNVSEQPDSGNDTVIVGYEAGTLYLNPNIENAVLTVAGTVIGTTVANSLTGSAGQDFLFGYAGNDTLNGGDGNDILDGGANNDTLVGGAGTDTMQGGDGDDVYYVDTLDRISELDGGGNDKAYTLTGFNLTTQGARYVEELYLIGTANIDGTGSDLAEKLFGNDGNNTLDGLAGNDTLEGGKGADVLKGGAGADSLVGGLGDDTYVIDADDHTLNGIEAEGEGRDTVQVDFDAYKLFVNFEDLTLTGSANISGTGNAVANFIRGNTGNNTLIGLEGDDSLMGGAGADRMEGGAGSDLYWVDNAGDVVVDSGAGFDRVLASVSYTLAANIEYLAFEGSGNFVGTGNDLDNTMYGNTGANTLDGGAGRDQLDGGEGNDKLIGGAGDDTITDWKGDDVLDGGAGKDDLRGGVGNDSYLVDGLDMVTELAGEGTDTVTASASFTLGSLAEVEILLAQAGKAAINPTGNDIANAVTGNDGANQLNGQGGNDALNGGLGGDTIAGGLGTDVLTGGAGKDRFVFDTLPDAVLNVDSILDFKAADDTIALENAVFTKLGKKAGALKASMFYAGKKAHDKDDRIIYDKKTGSLFYDADGTGKTKAVKFATVKKGAFLDYHDFLVI